MKNRIAVLHGVNLDQLGVRDPDGLRLADAHRARGAGQALGARARASRRTFTQTNHEGEFCETLHEARTTADGLLLNPGAWTHYSYAIRDAIEVDAACRRSRCTSRTSRGARSGAASRSSATSCIGHVQGKGVDGYREALEMLKEALS